MGTKARTHNATTIYKSPAVVLAREKAESQGKPFSTYVSDALKYWFLINEVAEKPIVQKSTIDALQQTLIRFGSDEMYDLGMLENLPELVQAANYKKPADEVKKAVDQIISLSNAERAILLIQADPSIST